MGKIQTPEQLALANKAASELGYSTVAGAKDYLSGLPVESLNGSAPTFPPNNNTNSNLTYEGILSSATSYLTEAQKKEAAAQTKMDAADIQIRDLMNKTTGKGQAILDAEKAANIDGQQNIINDLNKSILTRTTALRNAKLQDNYDIMNLEGRGGRPLELVRGEQARMERDRNYARQADASELANLVATSELLSGNLQTAKDNIERSIKLKYEDAERNLENEMFFYEKNWDKLSKAQQEKAAARIELLNAQKDAIAEKKDDERFIFDLQAQVAQAGGSKADIMAIGKAGSKEAAADLAYGYVGNQAAIDRDLSRQQARANISRAATEADTSFKFDSSTKSRLRSILSQAQIETLQKNIQQVGAEKALEMGSYSDVVYDAVADAVGLPKVEEQFLDRATIESTFATHENAVKAGYGDNGEGLFNLKTDKSKEYADSLEATINLYRKSGMTDSEILKLMSK